MEENKTKSWFRKSDALITAFLVPVLVLLVIYAQRGVYPFGDHTYLRMDMYHQYAPFFSEFRNKLTGTGSLLYSWNVGMGVNFIPIISYYLASPLNWVLAVIPQDHILEFMDYGIVLKTGLAGLTMAIFLEKHAVNSKYAPAFFGIFYALSGYMAAYSWNVMWLDCIVLFPLVCLGIDRIVFEKKGFVYGISLALCIVSNYYISIMICIFAVIYMLMLLIMKGKQSFGSFMGSVGIFAGFSLLAGGIAAALWFPQIFGYAATSSADSEFPTWVQSYFSVIDVIARHMMNVKTELELDHWPNIYCGVAVIPLTMMFVMNRKITLKEKCVYCAAIFLLISSFSISTLAYFWHGCHFPNSLPARQSFIYIFLVLYICFRAVDQMDGNTLKDIGIATAASVIFILLCQKLVDVDDFGWEVFYLSLAFVIIYLLFIYLYRAGKINVNLVTFIVLAVVSVEAAVNMTSTGISVTGRSQYLDDNKDVRAVVSFINERDDDFYRFEKNSRKSKNDGAWLNFHSVSLFASTANADMSSLFTRLGCEASTNAYVITGSTPLVDALFDVKYAIYQGECKDPNKTLVCSQGNTNLYENKYCLPLGFTISKNAAQMLKINMGHPALQQNQIARTFGTADVLKQVDGFREGGVYSFTASEDGLYYAFSENTKTDTLEISIGDRTRKLENVDRGYLIELGWLNKNDIVDLKPTDGTEVLMTAYRFNYDALGELTEKLSEDAVRVTYYDDTHIYASSDASGDRMFIMTVPYDEGWSVTVDGKPVDTYKAMDAFIGFDVGAGHHDIVLDFEPQGLKEGLLVSGISVAVLILVAIVVIIVTAVNKKKERINRERTEVRKDDETK
ncbi:MAG: YfhO family protein [Lachnospiraceae bacterium]|nr:YfhO family protein [Lachnospiraceae bacterium]